MNHNKERCIVAQVWVDTYLSMAILNDSVSSVLKERKDKLEYIENKYPWMKKLIELMPIPERIVLYGWLENRRFLDILQEHANAWCPDQINKQKAKMVKLEKDFPWLKKVIKILSSKKKCLIGEYEI